MSISAILPLKALDRSKQRLAARLDAGERQALMARLFTHVARVCAATPGIDRVCAVVGDATGAGLARSAGIEWVAEPTPDLDRALRLAERAAQLLPKSAEAQDTLGWVYY